jgi:hypothetical protein
MVPLFTTTGAVDPRPWQARHCVILMLTPLLLLLLLLGRRVDTLGATPPGM